MNRHLGRITIINGSHEYWILKYMNGQWYGKAIDGILQDYKEERRILLGLRFLYGTQIQAEVEYKSSVILDFRMYILMIRVLLMYLVVLPQWRWVLILVH